MAAETFNHFAMLAKHHLDLHDHSEFHKAAVCHIPRVDVSTLNLLESNAEVAIADIAAGMQGLAHLITNYPAGVGGEDTTLPQIGRLLRVLGEALEFTHDSAYMIADRQWAHGRIAAVEGKTC